METEFDKWTNSGGFYFILSVSAVDLEELSSQRILAGGVIYDLTDDLNKQSLFVRAHC